MKNQKIVEVVEIEKFREERKAAEAAILHEQQALHRLRRLEALAEERQARAKALVILLRPLGRALKWLFTPAVLMRRDAPHLPPVPQHEWDRGERYLQRFF